MEALLFGGAFVLLVVAFDVASSDAGRQFGIWDIAPAIA